MMAGVLCGHLHVLVSSFLLVLKWGGVHTVLYSLGHGSYDA